MKRIFLILMLFSNLHAMGDLDWQAQEAALNIFDYGPPIVTLYHEYVLGNNQADAVADAVQDDQVPADDSSSSSDSDNDEEVQNPNPLQCSHCNKICKTKYGLAVHIQAQHTPNRWRCDYAGCNRSYKYPSSLKDHKDRVHLGKTYTCEHCNKVYKNRTGLYHHKKKCYS